MKTVATVAHQLQPGEWEEHTRLTDRGRRSSSWSRRTEMFGSELDLLELGPSVNADLWFEDRYSFEIFDRIEAAIGEESD